LRTKQKILSLLFLTIVLSSSEPVDAAKCRPNPKHCGDPGQQESIPLKIYRNFLVVAQGQFGDALVPQNFILDTGTAPSMINAQLAAQLELATAPSTSVMGGKTVPTQSAIIPEIRLGPIRAVFLAVQVHDLSAYERELGIPIAGIIGLDVLSKSSFRLDYNKREIEFGRISHEGVPVHFDPSAGLAVADVRLEGKSVRMLVDTGSEHVVLLGGNFADVGWLALRNTSQTGATLGEHGLRVQVFPMPDIALGGMHLSQDRAYLVPDRADPEFDGFLSVRALGFRVLSYDQASGKIYLKK
jgi:hypothetical protein